MKDNMTNLTLRVNGIPVAFERIKFPAGETMIRVGPEAQQNIKASKVREPVKVSIDLIFLDNGDLIDLLMLTDAIRRELRMFELQVALILNYLPYARQDRVCNPGESLSVKVVCDLINSQNYDRVFVTDVHNEASLMGLNNCIHTTMTGAGDRLKSVLLDSNFLTTQYVLPILVSPDAGANKKVQDFARVNNFPQVVRADKVRDTLTGKLSGAVVYCEDQGNKDFMILDDICDGGGTFVLLAKELRKKTTGKIFLYVTHGIFSKGLQALEGIDVVFCANLMNPSPFTAETNVRLIVL